MAARWEKTTVGRVLFNAIVPTELGYQNREMKKKALARAGVRGVSPGRVSPRRCSSSTGSRSSDSRNATRGGVSIGIEDLQIPSEKETLLEEAEERVERFQRAYKTGNITNGERYNKVIDTWTHANNDVADAMVKTMRESKQRLQPRVHDVRFRLARQPRSDPPAGGDARTDGEAAEEADWWNRRDHRKPDQVEFP